METRVNDGINEKVNEKQRIIIRKLLTITDKWLICNKLLQIMG